MTLPTPVHRPWTFMIYMAGDNGKIFDTKAGRLRLMAPMEEAGYQDLFEMGSVGTTDKCAVTCLFDTPEASYLVEVRKGKRFTDSVVESIPAVNTGSPTTLSDFIVRSMQRYPADHTMLVIWNHGAGWLDKDAYATVRAVEADHATFGAIFRSTYREMAGSGVVRAIAFDDSSKDFLDAQGLRQAFSEAEQATGAHLDIIGMDACLMAMVEGARELAPFAGYFIGSQEVEPMDGWPYAPILAALNAEPGMAPDALSDKIVHEFAKSYKAQTRPVDEETVTQSAIALSHTAGTETLCKALVDAILAHRDDVSLKSLVLKARDQALVFQDRNYRDLGDFAARLVALTEMESYPDVTAAAKAVYDGLQARTADAAILRVAFRPRYQGATGLSIYWPSTFQPASQRDQALKTYRTLFFPQDTGWDQLLEWVYSEF